MNYDATNTPFQRFLEQPFEDTLEAARVKTAALALKERTDLVEQKQMMNRAFDNLLACAQRMYPSFRVAEQIAMVRF
jgi:hypothetical protein